MKANTVRYDKYDIKTGQIRGKWTARAFMDPGYQSRGIVAECQGISENEALEEVKAFLTERSRARVEARRYDNAMAFSVPCAEEFSEALRGLRITPVQEEMLKVHCSSGESGMTAEELAKAAGYKTWVSFNSQYGKLAHRIADFIGVDAPAAKVKNVNVYSGVLAGLGPARVDTDHFVWAMYPEMCEAVREMSG